MASGAGVKSTLDEGGLRASRSHSICSKTLQEVAGFSRVWPRYGAGCYQKNPLHRAKYEP